MKRLLLGAMTVVAAALTGRADLVTLLEGDAKGSNSFATSGHWSDGLAPHEDADYLVALGGTEGVDTGLRTPANAATSVTFLGKSLTVGTEEIGGILLHKAGNNATVTYPDLRLVNGLYSQGSEYTEQQRTSVLLGEWTVLSKAANPFSLLGANDRRFYVAANLHGADDAVLRICHSATELNGFIMIVLAGTNTAYNGSFVVDGNEAFLSAEFGDLDPLGAPDSPNNARAVVLRNGGGIRSETLTPTAVDPAKVFWVEASGGRIESAAGAEGKIALSFGGEGALSKTGDGLLVLAGSIANAGGVLVRNGELRIDEGITCAEGCVITAGGGASRGIVTGSSAAFAKVRVAAVAGGMIAPISPNDALVLSDATIDGGMIGAKIDVDAGAASMVTLDESCTVAWPLGIALDQQFPGMAGPDVYAILRVPAALKTVTAEDFVNKTPGSETGRPRVEIVVSEPDEDGFQTVSLRRTAKVVEMVATGDSNYFFASVTGSNGAQIWSDGLAVHGGADYIINAATAGKTLRTGDQNLQTADFAGDSLTLVGASASMMASLTLKAEFTTVNDLWAYGFSVMGAAGYKNQNECTHNFYGKIHVRSTVDAPFKLSGESNRTIALHDEIEGPATAHINMHPGGTSNGIRHYVPYAYNTNYFGSINLSQRGYGTPGLAKYQEISIEDERNLGGNPPEFKFDCLGLTYYSMLKARQSLTIDDPNRGIYMEGAAQFHVDGEDTLTILSPITLNNCKYLYKHGTGTLALGSSISYGTYGNSAKPETACQFSVTNGTLQVLAGGAISWMQVGMATGTRIVIDPLEGDDLLREKGVVNLDDMPYTWPEGEKLNLLLRCRQASRGDFEVPLLTVTSAAAEGLRGNIALEVERPRNYIVSLDEKAVDEGVCFTAKFTDLNGTILFVR
jgi:autotransporter-associated beta strand protein